MTKAVTENVLAAGALALVVTITRVGPAPRAPVAAAAHSPAPASECSVRDDGTRSPSFPALISLAPGPSPMTMARTPATAARAMTAGTTEMRAAARQRAEEGEK